MRIARALLLFVMTVSACTIRFEPFELNVQIGDDAPSALPTPKPPPGQPPAPSGDEPVLDDEQQTRADEVAHYIATVIYERGQIIASYQLPSGDVLDFIDRATLPALPYELPPLPITPDDLALPPGVDFGLTELEQIPELLALAATATPFHRPSFWPYILGQTDAVSIEDYLNRYRVGGTLSDSQHLYAGIGTEVLNRGVIGYVNQFRPNVEPGTFSVIELAVGCPAQGPQQEVVGVVISVDKLNAFDPNPQPYTDGEPRLHVEYARPDPITGQIQYHWDEEDGQFKRNPLRVHHPGQKVPYSVLGGTQVEHLVAIVQAPVTGDWWIMYNGDWLGYYPASLLKMSSTGACAAAWYGETARRKPTSATPWPKTEMGSANYAGAGFPKAAYVRNPRYMAPNVFGLALAPDPAGLKSMPPYNASCYNYIYDAGTGLEEFYLFLGGPGGKNSGCFLP